MEYVAKAGHWMGNHDQARPALPARLTPAEREFFVALRRLVDTSGLPPDVLAGRAASPVAGAAEPGELAGQYTAGQWRNWINGQSLPPRKAVRTLAEALASAKVDAGNLVDLWALAFMPTPYPQEPSGAFPGQRQPLAGPGGELAGRADRPAGGDDPGGVARAAFARGYRQLSEPAARMLRLLSLHPGPDVSLPAAASLAGVDLQEAGKAVAELASARLAQEHPVGRLACHYLHRGYAAQESRASDPADARHAALRRLLDHYLRTMVAAVSLGFPGTTIRLPIPPPRPGVVPEGITSEDQARAWCQRELPAIRALLTQVAGDDLDAYCWQIPSAMAIFLTRGGQWEDFLALQRIALAAAGRLADPLALGHASFHLAHACALVGEVADSDRHLRDALEYFTTAGEDAAAAATLNGMAQLFMQQGDYPGALDRAEEALRLRLKLGDRGAVAHSEETIGSIFSRLGDYVEALRHCYRSLDISRETGARLLAADALTTLGFVCLATGDAKRAIAFYMEVLVIYRQAGSNGLIAAALTGLGDAQRAAGEADSARASWQQALAVLKTLPGADDQPVRARLTRHRGLARRPVPRRESRLPREDGGGCPGGGGHRVGDPRQRPLVMRRRDEPGLERRWRQVHAAIQHRVEEGRVGGRRLVLGLGEAGHWRGAPDEEGEQVPGDRQVVRDAGLRQRRGHQLGQLARERVHRRVHLRRAGAQRGQPGGGGQRIARQRARLVDRASRGKPLHDLGPPAEGGAWQPAPHHLAERHEVPAHAVDPVPARRRHPEPGQHLVHDQQRAARGAQ
jgi:tetratricopeptide (TPR) repeat protein